ncbi:hypothetical protein [Spirillospora sp. NPDC029432]|uniref:hypothetical protein n=1 Tax=Spirillospora sp. NPDC029432 TaxID=3154599 RepID=UPI003454FF58
MSESIRFTVPEQTTSCFVVAAERAPGDPPQAALRRLPAPFATAAVERLGTPRLRIASYPAAYSPWNIGHATRVTDDDDPGLAERALAATHHIGVQAVAASGDRPFAHQLARAVAGAIAEHLDAVPVDADTGQILPARSCADTRFRLADGWLGAWLQNDRDGGRCKASEDDIDGCACVGFTTRGLTRFGLPELQMAGIACPHDLAALNVIRTTAQHLLHLGRRAGPRTFARDLPLTGADFAAFWGSGSPAWTDDPVVVRLTPFSPRLIRVGPPEDFPGTLNEWLWDELPPVLYDLLSCGADD